ncbi:MAG: MFS transporter [Lentisphaeria bacterium]|nr:MFS transporter [Lentisphaeria bacterium]
MKSSTARLFASDVPFDPRHLPFYYGWIILLIAVLAMAAGMPGQTVGFTPFTEPLLATSGLSRTALTQCYCIGTILAGILLPHGGHLVDRFGCRRFMCIAVVGVGLTMIYLSLVPATAGRLAGIVPAAAAWMLALTIGIFFLRFFGQGMLAVVSNTLIGRWFENRRGRAVAALSISNGIMFNSTPIVIYSITQHRGWRGAWLWLGLASCTLLPVVCWLFCRDSPETCGIVVDGQADDTGANGEPPGVTVAAAVRTLEFWTVVMVSAISGLIITGFTFHLVAIGAEAGVDEQKALVIFIPAACISIPAGFAISWVSDRLGVKRVLLFMCAAQLLCYAALGFLHLRTGYVLSILGLGLSGACMGPIMTLSMPAFFGRRHLGAIQGKYQSFLVFASAAGPLYFALVEHVTGTFRNAMLYALVIPVMGFVLTLKLQDRRY